MTIIRRSDIRDAARGLLHAPAVSISAILCLALGLGTTTAISSAIDRALLQPLPLREPDRLVTVFRTTPQFQTGPFSAPNYTDLAHGTRKLQSLAATTWTTLLMTLPDEAVQLTGMRVTGNFFQTLGANALYGRLLTPDDDKPDSPAAAVMGEQLWRQRFAADPTLVGRTITLDGRSYTVAGIVPEDFRVPHGGTLLRSDLWVPMRFSTNDMAGRHNNSFMLMGRLASGATAASADAELHQLFDGIVQTYPDLNGEQVHVVPMQAEGVRSVRTPLLLLGGAVIFVLLIAATNVASLLLARGVQRRRELAIRAALGGSRWAVMRPVLAESLLLAGIGVTLGLGLATAGVKTIGALAARRLPQLAGLSIDLRVFAFALILSLIVALLCGAVPAWRASAVDPQDALRGGRGGGAGAGHHRALGALVVIEVALSLVLLVGAGLVIKGFANLTNRDPGFRPDGLLTLETTISPKDYPGSATIERFLEPVLAAVEQVPGVQSATATLLLPYDNWGWNFNTRYEGVSGGDPTRLPLTEFRVVSPAFFRVTGQRLIAGRLLEQSDDERTGAQSSVVVNEALVRRDFAGQDPLGKRFYYGSGDTSFATIVGVVSNIRNVGPVAEPAPEAYWTFRQAARGTTRLPMMIRTTGDPMDASRAVQTAIRSVDHGAAISRVRTMHDVMATSVGRPKFYLSLLAVFAVVAVVLAVAGLYGVMSYSVAQRTREIGIRTALGSQAGRTMGLVAANGMRLVAFGVVLGLAGAAFLTRLLQSLLYGVSPLDPVTWALATASLAVAGLVATLVPAGRATRVDPLVAIRAE